MFPNTSPEYVVIKDIENWREYVHAPKTDFTDEEWAPFLAPLAEVDRNEVFVAPFVAPGIFEKLHYLMGMEECMINFYEYPDEMHELIDFLTDWEIEGAKEIIAHFHPDALFHHDDWGSQRSSFLSPEMFDEFITPAYKKIYGFWKANGVEIIIHHSDSYAANLVPSMIECGIDSWQGVMSTNDVPALVKEYGGKITFHGGIDMAVSQGTPIYAALDGTVTAVGYNATYGNYVIITHHSGYKTLYGHMKSTACRKGNFVYTNTVIGYVGSTGMSTGPHLHFTVYKNGKTINPIAVLN
jgi:hypothetical protein